jgi:D-cysteine desulfhydrase family pyridoxal phosphate-dependent enzyme
MKHVEKISLGFFPTPFSKIDSVSADTGVNFYIKRDDLCGIALGGNKVRKLEYLLADARAKGADTVLTSGGAQSNHATLTAACCRRLGLDCVLVLMKRGVTDTLGNLLLDDIMDVRVEFVDSDSYEVVYGEAEKIMADLRSRGKKPYFIPVGGSVALGALGYYDAVHEIVNQAKAMGVRVDHIVLTTGSGGTHAGSLLAAKELGIKVTGILVSPGDFFQAGIYGLVGETAELIGSGTKITMDDIVLKPYFGDGYAIPSPEGTAAIKYLAQKEGIFLDPVYTGKTFAGFLDLAKQGYFKRNENVVFIHTGGAAALFAIPM